MNLLVRDQVTTCLTRRHSCDNSRLEVTNSVTSHRRRRDAARMITGGGEHEHSMPEIDRRRHGQDDQFLRLPPGRARSHVLARLPHLGKLNLQNRSTQVLREQRKDLVDTCCRRRPDRVDTPFVRRFANLLGERMARVDQIRRTEPHCREDRNVTQVEDLLEVRRYGPQLTRKEILDLDALPYCLAHELRRHAGSGEAQVDDGKAPGRVVPTPETSGAFAAARVEARRLVAVADTRETDETDAVQAGGVEARHLTPLRPQRARAAGRSRAGTGRRRRDRAASRSRGRGSASAARGEPHRPA